MAYCKPEGNTKEVNQGELQEVASDLGRERSELAMAGGHSRTESLGPWESQMLAYFTQAHKVLELGLESRSLV